METEGGAGLNGEGDTGIDHETVVDDKRACGCEGGVGLDGDVACEVADVLGDDGAFHQVFLEEDFVIVET